MDPDCLPKAEEKVSNAFAKADAKGPCTTKIAGMFETAVDDFVIDIYKAVNCGAFDATCGSEADCCSNVCFSGFCF